MNNKRLEEIYSLLQIHKKLSVSELADRFQVTKTTIRRDLLVMEENGQAKRRRGYAILPTPTDRESLKKFNLENLFLQEKMLIGKKAAEFVRSNMSIALDSGSTVDSMINYVLDNPSIDGVNIVTSSLTQALKTCSRFHTSIPGGLVLPGEKSTGGLEVSDFFKQIHLDIAFLGSTGVYNTNGLTVSYTLMQSVKNAMAKSAAKRIGLLDSSKYNSRGIYTFCNWDDLDILITVETPENREMLKNIASHNVQIICV